MTNMKTTKAWAAIDKTDEICEDAVSRSYQTAMNYYLDHYGKFITPMVMEVVLVKADDWADHGREFNELQETNKVHESHIKHLESENDYFRNILADLKHDLTYKYTDRKDYENLKKEKEDLETQLAEERKGKEWLAQTLKELTGNTLQSAEVKYNDLKQAIKEFYLHDFNQLTTKIRNISYK